MAQIVLNNVVAEFPVYGSEPSLRNALFGKVVGGVMRRQAGEGNRVVVRALENVTLTVNHGDQLGIIGQTAPANRRCCGSLPGSISRALARSPSKVASRLCSVPRRGSISTTPVTRNRDLRPSARHEPRRDRTQAPRDRSVQRIERLPRAADSGLFDRHAGAPRLCHRYRDRPENPAARRGPRHRRARFARTPQKASRG